ncbi:MAG: hypothetical protein IJY20_03750 [Clostridia bacterium]|nr:hypothetical protein [Clostridia bacterium]
MMMTDLPLGFMAALAQDKRAMQSFAQMGDREQEAVLSRARRARSKADMQLIVLSLSEEWNATEGY